MRCSFLLPPYKFYSLITGLLTGILSMAMIGLSCWHYSKEYTTAKAGFLREQELLLHALANECTIKLATWDVEGLSHILNRVWQEDPGSRVGFTVHDASGDSLAIAPPSKEGTGSSMRQLVALETPIVIRRWNQQGVETIIPLGSVRGRFSMAQMEAKLRAVFIESMAFLLVLIAPVSLAVLIVARNITKPLGELTEAAKHIAMEQFDMEFTTTTTTTTTIEVLELIGSFRNMVTQLKTARQALRVREAGLWQLSVAMEQTGDSIFITDREGVIEYVNPAFTAAMGYSREEVLGRKPSLLKSGQYDRRFYKELWETILAGRVWRGAIDNRRKDGALITLEQTISPIRDAQGQITHFVSTTKDITERKKLETMVLQSEKMAAVGQLAAGVAHEINNPLGIMLGFAQSLTKRIKADDPLSLPVKSIEREALRCKNLVQNLLTFSRENKSQAQEFDLNETLTDTLGIIEAQARVKSVEVVHEFASLPLLLGDKNQIQQVIINLCNNALDAMPNGGKIVLRTRGNAVDGKRRIVLEVEDSGSGIPEEIRDKVFNPFFTTKEVGKGTGLGLSLVHEIIQKHDGRIELKSVVGQGTVFTIAFPVKTPGGHECTENGSRA